jgi:ABC-type Fe3+ transport system substrate-binding protein
VWVGQANAWSVGCVFEASSASAAGLPSNGPVTMPNTVAMLRNCPNPAGAASLMNFLLSARGEELLAATESRNVPIRAELATRLAAADARLQLPTPAPVLWSSIAASMSEADALIAKHFPL